MEFCNNCGTQIPDGAKFCPKCGNVITEPQAQQEAPAQAPAATEKKSAGAVGFFDKYFWVFYIVTGVCAYLFMELGSLYCNVSTSFGIFLGIMVIIFALCFLAFGILKKVLSYKKPAEEREKHATRDSVCLAVSIVIFTVTLIGAIGIFNICAQLNMIL